MTFTDVDLSDTHAVTVTGVSTAGVTTGLPNTPTLLSWLSLGALTDTTGTGIGGSDAWTFSAQDKSFDYLAVGETVTLTYTVQVDDHHGGVVSQPVTITITGTNDTPVITSATSNAFSELPGTNNAATDTVSGTISFTDVDLSDRPTVTAPFASYSYIAADGHTALTLTAGQQSALETALTIVPAAGNTDNGSASWTYSVADRALDFLAQNETLTLTYTATVNDHHGGVVPTPITVTIPGTRRAGSEQCGGDCILHGAQSGGDAVVWGDGERRRQYDAGLGDGLDHGRVPVRGHAGGDDGGYRHHGELRTRRRGCCR